MTKRDDSGLVVPIEEAIAGAEKELNELEWQAADVSQPTAYRRDALFRATLKKGTLSDLIRRRDAGEEYEVMF